MPIQNHETTPIVKLTKDEAKFFERIKAIKDAKDKINLNIQSESAQKEYKKLQKLWSQGASSDSPKVFDIKEHSTLGARQMAESKKFQPPVQASPLPKHPPKIIRTKFRFTKQDLTDKQFTALKKLAALKSELALHGINLRLRGSFVLEAATKYIWGEKCFVANDIDAAINLSKRPEKLDILKKVMAKHGFNKDEYSSETCINFKSNDDGIDISAILPNHQKNYNPFPLTTFNMDFELKDETFLCILNKMAANAFNTQVGNGKFPVKLPAYDNQGVRNFSYRFLKYTQPSKNTLTPEIKRNIKHIKHIKHIKISTDNWHHYLNDYFYQLFRDKRIRSHLGHHYHTLQRMIESDLFSKNSAKDFIYYFCKAKLRVSAKHSNPSQVAEAAQNITHYLQKYFDNNPSQASHFSEKLDELSRQPLIQLANGAYFISLDLNNMIKDGSFSQSSSRETIFNYCRQLLLTHFQGEEQLLTQASINMTFILQKCFDQKLLSAHNFSIMVKDLCKRNNELSNEENVQVLIDSIANKLFSDSKTVSALTVLSSSQTLSPSTPTPSTSTTLSSTRTPSPSTSTTSSSTRTPSPSTPTTSSSTRTPSPYSPKFNLSFSQPSSEILREDSPQGLSPTGFAPHNVTVPDNDSEGFIDDDPGSTPHFLGEIYKAYMHK